MGSRTPEPTFVERAWRQLASLLERPQPPRRPERAAERLPEPGAPAAPDGDAVPPGLDVLGKAEGGLGSVAAGRVHLLSLEPVRNRLGTRWERSAERVQRTVETELRSRLGSRDFHSKTSEISYVIVFGDCSEAEAKLKVALLTESILSKLFGSKEAEELRQHAVRSVITGPNGQLATAALESTDTLLASLAAAQPLEHAGEDGPEGSEASAGEQEITQLLADLENQLLVLQDGKKDGQEPRVKIDRLHEIVAHLKALEGNMVRRLDELAGAGGPSRPDLVLNPGLIRVAHRSLKALRQIKRQAEGQLEQSERERPCALPGDEELGATDLVVRYRPFWHVESQKIAVYGAEGWLVSEDGACVDGDIGFDEDLEEAVDRLVLLHSRRDLEAAIKAKSPAVVAIPVHYGTLARIGSQRRYLDLCRNIREEHRRCVLWQFVGVPRQVFQSQLRGFMQQLRPFGRSATLLLTLTEQTYPHLARDLEQVALAGVNGIGIDARSVGATEGDLIKLFDYVATLAGKAKLKSYLSGVQTNSLVLAASGAGFDYIAGPAIAEPLDRLDGIRIAELDEIYLHAST